MNNFLKKVYALMALTALSGGSLFAVNSSSLFTDIDDSFAKSYIESFALDGIVVGYSDGSFRPNNAVTRAEFLAITMNAFHISVSGITSTPFEDIPTGDGAWILGYAEKARQLGIVYGQTIGGTLRFRPNDSITRAEAIIIVLRVADIAVNTSMQTTAFEDVGSVLIPYVESARQLGIVQGQVIGSSLMFRPYASLSRAEAVKIAMKTSLL